MKSAGLRIFAGALTGSSKITYNVQCVGILDRTDRDAEKRHLSVSCPHRRTEFNYQRLHHAEMTFASLVSHPSG